MIDIIAYILSGSIILGLILLVYMICLLIYEANKGRINGWILFKTKEPADPVQKFTPSPSVVRLFEEYGLEYSPLSDGTELWRRMEARREFNKSIMDKG